MFLQRTVPQVLAKSHRCFDRVQQRYFVINSAKKAHQYTEMSLYHMIDIFLCPEQDLYFSAIEGRPKAVHPENLRICESLLREMSTKASQDRYAVMEAYVTIMKGNPKQLEAVHGRLIEVLSLVNLIVISEIRVPSSVVGDGNGEIHDG